MVECVCKVCGQKFEARTQRAEVCSSVCRQVRQHPDNRLEKCEKCGEFFATREPAQKVCRACRQKVRVAKNPQMPQRKSGSRYKDIQRYNREHPLESGFRGYRCFALSGRI
jgi:hypothetical protein